MDLAVKFGLVTTGQRDGKLAMLKGMPEAVARELSAAEPVFPGMRREPSEGPQTGSAYKPKSDEPTEFPKDLGAQLALHKSNPTLYATLRKQAIASGA